MTGKALLDNLRSQFERDGLCPFGTVRGWTEPNHIVATGEWTIRERNSTLIISVSVDGKACGLRFKHYEKIDSQGDPIAAHEPTNPNSLSNRIAKAAESIGLQVIEVRYTGHQQVWDSSVSYRIIVKRPAELESGPPPQESRGGFKLGMWTPRPIRRGRYESRSVEMNVQQLIESMIDDMLLAEAGAVEYVLVRHLPSGQYQDITRVFAFDREHAIFLLKRRGFHKVGTDQTLKVMSLDEYNDMYFKLALKAKSAGSKTPLRAGAYR